MRRVGKTISALLHMKINLDKGETVLFIGVEEPEHYLEMLETLNCKCTAEPEYTKSPPQEVSDEITGVVYLTKERKVLTGYRFKKI